MNVLVTGSDGYIGVRLTQLLSQRGMNVIGLDTGFYREGWLYPIAYSLPRTISKDTRRVTEEDLEGIDAVVHLAELSNDPLGQLRPEVTHKINHEGSIRLAKLCRKVGVERFVYSSSCSVYGVGNEDWKDEQSEVQPLTAYAECKVLVEQDLSSMADDNFSPTFLRNSTAFGPSPRMRFDIVLNNLAGLAWTTHEIRMTSDGSPWRPLVHVMDICDAMGCVLQAPREIIHNQTFNVGNTRSNYQIKDLALIVQAVFQGCELTFGPSDGDHRSYRVSCDKIASVLPDFKADRTPEQGARELRAVFESVGLNESLFNHRAFTRLKALSHLLDTGQVDSEFFFAGIPGVVETSKEGMVR